MTAANIHEDRSYSSYLHLRFFYCKYRLIEQSVFLDERYKIINDKQVASPLSRPNSEQLASLTRYILESLFLFHYAADLFDSSVGKDFDIADTFAAIRKASGFLCTSHDVHTFLICCAKTVCKPQYLSRAPCGGLSLRTILTGNHRAAVCFTASWESHPRSLRAGPSFGSIIVPCICLRIAESSSTFGSRNSRYTL